MSETTEPEARDLTPQPNQILAEPATVQNCAADYEAGADVRVRMARQEAAQHGR